MKEMKTGAKAPFGHQINISTFIDLCGFFFSNGALLLVSKNNPLPELQPGFGDPYGALLVNGLLECSPVPPTGSLAWIQKMSSSDSISSMTRVPYEVY